MANEKADQKAAREPQACIVCDNVPRAVFEGSMQPYGATTFESHGHYGSTFFDPMHGSQSITINVCDDCLREKRQAVCMVTTETRVTRDYEPFHA